MLFGLQPPRQSAKFKPKASIMRDNSFQYNIDIGNISLIFSNNTSIAFALVRSLRISAVFFVLCSLSTQRGYFSEVVFLAGWVFYFGGLSTQCSPVVRNVGSCQLPAGFVAILVVVAIFVCTPNRSRVCNVNAFDFRLMSADRLKHNHYKTYAK